MALVIKEHVKNQSINEYIVGVFDKCKENKVIGCSLDQTIICNCKKFETFEIFCAYALKILDLINIKIIPDKYILNRLTKEGRNGNVTNIIGENLQPKEKLEYADHYKYLSLIYSELIKDVYESKEGFDLLNEVVKNLKNGLVKIEKIEFNMQKKKKKAR